MHIGRETGKWILVSLVAVGLVLRLWALDSVPPGLDSDEASIGYNAYSILKTGRDEYGAYHPLAFRAFGEYKRPAYIYATVPSIAAFGPTPFAIRLPAAIFGTLSIPAIYAVALLLLRSRRAALCAAGMLALSPWHLQFSRGGREVCLMLFALLTMAACLLAAAHALHVTAPERVGARRAGWLSIGAAVAAAVALYSYPGALLLVPLLLAVLARPYWGRLRHLPHGWAAATAGIALLALLPLGRQFLDGRALARPGQVSLLADPTIGALAAERIALNQHAGLPVVLESPAVLAVRQAINNYLAHFSVSYLFTQGDKEWRHHSSDMGQVYLWDAPLLLVGLAALARGWPRPAAQAIAGWLVVGPLPAALADNAPHAVRSMAMLPALYLMAAAGVAGLWRWLRRRRLHLDWLLLLAASVAYYLYAYYRYYPYEHTREWAAGALEGLAAARDAVASGSYQRVVVSGHAEFRYLHVLLAARYDPAAYLAAGGTNPAEPVLTFPPYEVRVIDWQDEPHVPNVLYALDGGTPLPAGARVVRAIQDGSGHDAVLLVDFPRAG